jgi:hypothetical protein
MVHVASVWVPFTSESKEAIASYPEIQKEIRLALQAVGRKLGMYMRRRLRVAQEGQRRSIFLRYLGEVATAVATINGVDRDELYQRLLAVAKKKTAEADVKLDDRGRPIEEQDDLDLGDNCIVVPQIVPVMAAQPAEEAGPAKPTKKAKKPEEMGAGDQGRCSVGPRAMRASTSLSSRRSSTAPALRKRPISNTSSEAQPEGAGSGDTMTSARPQSCAKIRRSSTSDRVRPSSS